MSETTFWDRLASVPLAELRATRERLDDEYARRQALLDELEARKTALDSRGATERGLRQQQALARQMAGLDRQAALEARLMQLLGKQQQLLDRLLWARESAARLKVLRAAAPVAVALDWRDLVDAALDQDGLEGKLDGLLRILGIPEEGWPPREGPGAAEEPSDGVRGPGIDAAPEGQALVARVLDGQKVRLATGETVRYIGVDAPLLQGALGSPDIGAREAWLANRQLVEGQTVRLEADTENQDPEGALWRTVWLGDVCANAELIRRGLAYHRPRSPNYRYLDWFSRLQSQAKRRKRGLWA